MLAPATPLEPKDPKRPLQVLIIGRISTVHQNEENINASYRYVESYLGRLYQGPIEIRHLGERASGMLVDRATIREAEDLIATGSWDLVIAEDLSRIFRNPRHQYNFVQDAVDAHIRGVPVEDMDDYETHRHRREVDQEVKPRQAVHEAELLAESEIGQRILKLREEKENLVDAVWLAMSLDQIQELWSKTADLLNAEPRPVEREVFAIIPRED